MSGNGHDTARHVAYLGPAGTFTHEAALIAVPGASVRPLPTVEHVAAAVRDGTVEFGVVPIENSIEGSVAVTLDTLAFADPGVLIVGEVTRPISLALLGPAGTPLDAVRAVHSHPHALAQARGWLRETLPDAAVEAAASTSEAARQVAAGELAPGAVALGPVAAAERWHLAVLARDLQDHAGNTTRFVVLGGDLPPPTGADKTSLVVTFGEDRPGLLLRVLDEFALRGVNLTKIESRPTKERLGEYAIFIDCAGHARAARVGEALRSVHRHVARMRVLGSYPRADQVADDPAPADSDDAYRQAAAWYDALVAEPSRRAERN